MLPKWAPGIPDHIAGDNPINVAGNAEIRDLTEAQHSSVPQSRDRPSAIGMFKR